MDALLHISNLLQHATDDADAAGQCEAADNLRAAGMLVWHALRATACPPVRPYASEVPADGTLEALMLARNGVRS